MRSELTNDEVFVLCALHGSTEIVGVANPFIAMPDEEISAKLDNVIEKLETKDFVHKEDNRYVVNDSIKEIVDFISSPETTYILAEEDDAEYVFMKNDKALHMKNVNLENCFFTDLDTGEKTKKFFKEKFSFYKSHTDAVQYMLSIPSNTMDKAIDKAEKGQMAEAIETLSGDDFEKEEMENMLNSIIFPLLSKTVICSKSIHGITHESIYKICSTVKGAWIVKISTTDEGANTLVYKATDDDITKIIFEF